MYYTYDRLSRVTAGTVKRISDNELITADGHTYTYNAEGVRIRNLCECGEDTTYTYNTNCKLSRLLMKTTDGVVTKYVYGNGLIGEEVENTFKTYHFDFRGSTIAITDASGNITDTFAYDTYGKCISRTGTSDVIFGYNGRDGVVTDGNGLIYMRARYYSPEMKRFINADIVAGAITNAVTLNRFAYANGNPVSFVDPFGLSAERFGTVTTQGTKVVRVGFWDIFKNDDGSYSLYDNNRGGGDEVFHEQVIVIRPSGPSFDLKEDNIGLGSLEVDLITGGWEGEYVDFSLLDFGHAEAGAEFKDGRFRLGAMASAWSPSIAFEIFDIEIELGAEIGSVGVGGSATSDGISFGFSFLYGGKLSVNW